MKRHIVVVMLLLSVVCVIPTAQTETSLGDAWDGLIVTSDKITYTQQDAIRYMDLYAQSYAKGDDVWKETIEAKAEYGATSTHHIKEAMPNHDDISEEEAICTAYAQIEKQYGLSDEEFLHFFPRVDFLINDEDDRRLWSVHFHLLSEHQDKLAELGSYTVYILSTDGTIVRTNSAADAVG